MEAVDGAEQGHEQDADHRYRDRELLRRTLVEQGGTAIATARRLGVHTTLTECHFRFNSSSGSTSRDEKILSPENTAEHPLTWRLREAQESP